MIRTLLSRYLPAQTDDAPPPPDSMRLDAQTWGDIPHTPWASAQACQPQDADATAPAHPAIEQADEDLRFPAGYYLALAAALVGSALASAWWPWGLALPP